MINTIEKLEESINHVINVLNTELIGSKRRNRLMFLAQKFSRYEMLCLKLASEKLSTSKFKAGEKVQSIRTKEKGIVSHTNDDLVFVKFDNSPSSKYLDGANARACYPTTLVKLEDLLYNV